MADDELDALYRERPEAFTAERAKLAAAARKRGDTAAAKRISASRKPTTSAWIVNRLALEHQDTARRLGDLGDRLRDAHAAMDGDRIRELSAEQHKLIGQLARTAFETARIRTPSPTARDDVTSTLQAAIADPDVRARLGRLTGPEQWSGFGASADLPPEPGPPPKRGRKAKRSGPPAQRPDDGAARRREELTAVVMGAERNLAEADEALSARQADRAAAQHRRDEALAGLRAAERELDAADGEYQKAKRASRTAAQVVRGAKAQLERG
ncbi:hypothetical protein MSAS_08500 [Mycobacterium saskatchewanense]|uniref:Uncharacterized protein n=1 Tax=Mycobacterium saskatchewanense TaxID=220927 RepID=A0AAJ3TTS0_9MYCO|nr:hypothetical protein [Mycobacterium saskatchewanense]ORW69027.1 hypothetical protein AWC23_19930 [Mycobacterium saskatchewanense]BBX61676.1 hypothetical protein MSAS_08500 [Mycobacterium saskatchewanense]